MTDGRPSLDPLHTMDAHTGRHFTLASGHRTRSENRALPDRQWPLMVPISCIFICIQAVAEHRALCNRRRHFADATRNGMKVLTVGVMTLWEKAIYFLISYGYCRTIMS